MDAEQMKKSTENNVEISIGPSAAIVNTQMVADDKDFTVDVPAPSLLMNMVAVLEEMKQAQHAQHERNDIEGEKQTARTVLAGSIGAFVGVVSSEKSNIWAAVVLLFIIMAISMVAIYLDTIVHQPSPKAFRFLNIISFVFVAIAMGNLGFTG